MRFKNVEEMAAVVRSFENATISRETWKHAEHLTVALHYLELHDIETATEKMREGIFNLLTNGFGIDLKTEMPYHETLTVFWMRTVAEFNLERPGVSLIDKANELVATFDKDYPLKFYSRGRLYSDEARSRYVSPDVIDH